MKTIVMADNSLTFHEFEDCLWVRCSARGCFVNSPQLKNIADKYLEREGKNIVVDLELCPGVDSTFMGTLAGIARHCLQKNGSLHIADPTERTRASMESLGLDMLLEIDPPDAAWQADKAERRSTMVQDSQSLGDNESAPLSELERTRHVLEAHNTLRSMNRQNDETFGYVCETLEEDLMRHENEQSDEV